MRTLRYLVGLLALAVLTTACVKEEKKEQREIIRPVVTRKVGGVIAMRSRVFSGAAHDALETNLSFRVQGEIVSLPAKNGIRVKKGTVIARLDPKDYELDVKRAAANLQEVKALYVKNKADLDRYTRLYAKAVVSKSELDNSQAAFDSAKAQLDAARKQLEIARQQLSYTVLHAPVDGTLATVPVDNHQTVSPGQTVAILTSGSEMEVQVGIPDSLIHLVHPGKQVVVEFNALPDEMFNATVSEVGVESDTISTYPIKVTLDNLDPRIRPGMAADVTFRFESFSGGHVLVPAGAVAGETDERFVWTVNPETSTVHKRIVRIGKLTSDGLQVTSGLTPGEIILVRGVHSVLEGQKVRLADAL